MRETIPGDGVLQTALAYLQAGRGVLPIIPDGSKRPALPKNHGYLYNRPTEADLHCWFGSGEKASASQAARCLATPSVWTSKP
jgi:hypothetical protein